MPHKSLGVAINKFFASTVAQWKNVQVQWTCLLTTRWVFFVLCSPLAHTHYSHSIDSHKMEMKWHSISKEKSNAETKSSDYAWSHERTKPIIFKTQTQYAAQPKHENTKEAEKKHSSLAENYCFILCREMCLFVKKNRKSECMKWLNCCFYYIVICSFIYLWMFGYLRLLVWCDTTSTPFRLLLSISEMGDVEVNYLMQSQMFFFYFSRFVICK